MREKIFFAAALFLGLTGSAISMLEWDLTIFGYLFAAPFSFSGVGNGFLLIFNRLFAISEQYQQFRYVMFHISSPQGDWSGNIAAAFALICAIFAGLSYALAATHRKLPIIAVFLVVVGVQIYFGVFPAALWNITLFAAIALMLARSGAAFRGIVAVAVLLGVISAAVWAVYPGRNPWLYQFSESIRDRFDTPLNPFAVAPFSTHNIVPNPEPDHLDLAAVDAREDTLHEMAVEGYIVDYYDRAQGAEIGAAPAAASLLPAVILVVSLLILAAVIHYAPPLWRAAKRRRMFEADDCPTAINNMFIYLLEWLCIFGLQRENVVFSAYASQLAVLVSPQFSEEYERHTALWQRAVYSDHTAGEAERKQMQEFLQATSALVLKRARLADKLRIKFQLFL